MCVQGEDFEDWYHLQGRMSEVVGGYNENIIYSSVEFEMLYLHSNQKLWSQNVFDVYIALARHTDVLAVKP